jgi:hypothetical protein
VRHLDTPSRSRPRSRSQSVTVRIGLDDLDPLFLARESRTLHAVLQSDALDRCTRKPNCKPLNRWPSWYPKTKKRCDANKPNAPVDSICSKASSVWSQEKTKLVGPFLHAPPFPHVAGTEFESARYAGPMGVGRRDEEFAHYA